MKSWIIKEIPITILGTVGMGFKGDIRDLYKDALAEAVSIKDYSLTQKTDHFKRITKPLVIVSAAGEEIFPKHCNNKLMDIMKMTNL